MCVFFCWSHGGRWRRNSDMRHAYIVVSVFCRWPFFKMFLLIRTSFDLRAERRKRNAVWAIVNGYYMERYNSVVWDLKFELTLFNLIYSWGLKTGGWRMSACIIHEPSLRVSSFYITFEMYLIRALLWYYCGDWKDGQSQRTTGGKRQVTRSKVVQRMGAGP